LHFPKHRDALTRSWLLARGYSGFIWVGVICFFSLSLVFRNLFDGYDLSYDELYSALSVSSGSLRSTFVDWVLPDTHPPLHALSLFVWRLMFGDSEVSLRILSASFSVLTLFIWGLFAIGLSSLPLLAGFPFIALNPYFIFFSNEVRGYSGLIYASTLVLFSLLLRADSFSSCRENLNPRFAVFLRTISSDLFFAFALMQVSLFHYYGFIYALLVLFLDCFLYSRSFRFALISLAAILVWPTIQLVVFRSDQVGRVSWLPSDPITGALKAFLGSTLPGFRVYQLAALAIGIVVVLIIGFSSAGRRKLQGYSSLAQLAFPLASLLVSFLIAIICLDLVKPIVLEKYFVVLLPAVSLLFGVAIAVPLVVLRRLSLQASLMLALPLSLFAGFYLESIRSYRSQASHKVDSKISYTSSRTFNFLRSSKLCQLEACAVGPGLAFNVQAGDSRGMVLSRYGLANGFRSLSADGGSLVFISSSSSSSRSSLGSIPIGQFRRLAPVLLEGFDLGGSLAHSNSSRLAESLLLRQRGYQCFHYDKNSPVKIWATGSVRADLDLLHAGFQECS